MGLEATALFLIRHAPVAAPGLAGRRDVPAAPPDPALAARLRAMIGPVDAVHVSPAQRARITAEALFPGRGVVDPRLWEQDFGAWEGTVPPDLGPMSAADLARHRPPGGESFADLCARMAPALREAATGGRVAIVAHAGTVRGALALALDSAAAALAFEVAPLSVTLIRALPVGDGLAWSVGWTNRIPE